MYSFIFKQGVYRYAIQINNKNKQTNMNFAFGMMSLYSLTLSLCPCLGETRVGWYSFDSLPYFSGIIYSNYNKRQMKGQLYINMF